jgi:NAD(P)-dependent dehydrogenase (short-subunit alcohol dehydrogenase family)
VDGLAYLPGTINLKPFHLLRRKDFVRDLEVNYLGAVKTLQHFLPQLRKADSASVVLMTDLPEPLTNCVAFWTVRKRIMVKAASRRPRCAATFRPESWRPGR